MGRKLALILWLSVLIKVIVAQNYTPKDNILLNCGATDKQTSDSDGRKWNSDNGSKFLSSSKNTTTAPADSQAPDVAEVPFLTARIFQSEFSYNIAVAPGRKFVRLYFYPNSYAGHNTTNAIFSVAAGPFTLLSNFSAAQTTEALNYDYLIKEYSINVEGDTLTLTFTPSSNYTNSFAFINGIEVVSMPDIYQDADGTPFVGGGVNFIIDNSTALEGLYRLNVGGNYIPPTKDTGLFRSWSDDTPYIFGAATGTTNVADVNVTYPDSIPSYTAPVDVYSTARFMTMNNSINVNFNLTWLFTVDTGFSYLVRLHFCEIFSNITKDNQIVFNIFLNNQTATPGYDIIALAGSNGTPNVQDFVVIPPPSKDPQQDLWLDLHPDTSSKPNYYNAFLNGVEVFKINGTDGSLAGQNPIPAPTQEVVGTHSFTFDHVYGSSASPSSSMFEECAAPLVDGLFQGYNATVLAYGQTGSGKTYTMGTAFREGGHTGIIPQVMNALYSKIEKLKNETEFQLHVSFIEIHKEEVRDLLDSFLSTKSETANAGKVNIPGKPPIQIRESSNGVITLAGSTEVEVRSLKEMAACLEQGSLCRATGSTNMNNQSSRSHAIFTITLEQMRKLSHTDPEDANVNESMNEEYLSAKLHLVDLAGSERAKRTGSDGMRFKEGVHINKGLLALGNVISALGDEKKRKEGVHVPYRDSKLTRLLQDSLGGNSRTVMIACISPADINAEETLNTLKYANRARNIQNKPVINRDPISSEMIKMRQQLEYLQAELCARGGGTSSDDVQALKERISWLESTNEDLRRELNKYRSGYNVDDQGDTLCQSGEIGSVKNEGHKRRQSMDTSDYAMGEIVMGDSKDMDEESAKEWEHKVLQTTMDKELSELNKRLQQKESEMKLFGEADTETLKQHFGKKLMELEDEKRAVQQERDRLSAEIENLAASSDGQTQKLQDVHSQKLKALEAQILDLKKKQENQVQLLKQKQKSEEAAKRLQEEIQFIKAQKVQLQHKIKQEAEQFRLWKASREKELLQLRKEGRRNEYERHKLQALNQRQKQVLQRKTEEAAMATKRLKELLEARKSSARDSSVLANGNGTNGQTNEKTLQRWLDHELEVMVNVHEVRYEYEKQTQVRTALAEELSVLKQLEELSSKGLSTPKGKNGFSRLSSLSPNARMARIASLENMLSISSNSLVAMASQLSEAEERERGVSSRGRWNQLRLMGDAKCLLQYMFNSLADTRCHLYDKETEMKEMKEQLKELVGLLRQSETRRKEVEKELKLREQSAAVALATSASNNSPGSLKNTLYDMSDPLSPIAAPAQKQLKYSPGIANGQVREATAYIDPKKMVPLGQLSMKKLAVAGQSSKLWRWKRSHRQWILQFKWKWQKPWKLSEWIKHCDETIVKTRPRPQALKDTI